MAETDPRKKFAQQLRDMYSAGSLDPLNLKEGLSQEMYDTSTRLGIADENLNKFISKLGTPVQRLRRQNATRREERAEAMKRARQPDASSGREPMRTSLVTTGLRDEFGNPYTRSLDTPGAQARRRERADETPEEAADKGKRTQDDAQVDRAREIQKKMDADKAEGAAEKNERDAKKTGKDLKQAIKKLKQERQQAKLKNR